jgi:hypothetical protein
VQRKRRPAEVDLERFFQSFNTPGNEVAPGSDEIRKNLQNVFSSFSRHRANPFVQGVMFQHIVFAVDLPRPAPYSGCQNNVPIVGRYSVTTTYAAILFSGTLL